MLSADLDLLALLSPEYRRALLARCVHRVFDPSEVLVSQGSTPHASYRLHSGVTRVHRDQCGARVELARMGPGDWFGELSLLDGSLSPVTVTAETRVEVDQLSAASLKELIAETPLAGVAFYQALALTQSRRQQQPTKTIPERLLDVAARDDSSIATGTLHEYLGPTSLCDFTHPSIHALAATLSDGERDESAIARRVFLYVRDEIRYGRSVSQKRASETLAELRGSCCEKANLFVALMRSLGIPAGFHFMFLNTRDYLGPIATPRFIQFMSPRSLHVLSAAWIKGRWLRCDPTYDARFADQVDAFNPPSKRIDFDGRTDAMLDVRASAIDYYDARCWPNIDDILAGTPRLPRDVVEVLNLYVDFARENGLRYPAANAASDAFFAWLDQEGPELLSAYEDQEALLALQVPEVTPPPD